MVSLDPYFDKNRTGSYFTEFQKERTSQQLEQCTLFN